MWQIGSKVELQREMFISTLNIQYSLPELRGRVGEAKASKPFYGGSNPPVTAVFHMASNHSFIQGGVSTLPSFLYLWA